MHIFLTVLMSLECAVKPAWCGIFTTPHGKKNIVVVAVDEAHCIEDWLVAFIHALRGIAYNIISLRGKDFRTVFSKIGGLRAVTSVPFMALTATASSTTQKLISQLLHLENPVVVSCSLNRPNICFSASSMKGYNVSARTCTGMFGSWYVLVSIHWHCLSWSFVSG